MTNPEDKSGWKEFLEGTDRNEKDAPPIKKPMNSVLKVISVILIGIPLGLFALFFLVLGVCFLGVR